MLNIPVSSPRIAQVITIVVGLATVLVAHFVPAYSVLLSQILTVLGIGAVGVGGASFTGKVPPAALVLLLAGLCLPLQACSRLANVDWSQVANCAEQPAESALKQIISDVLAGTGDVKTELEGVAAEYGPGVVKCIVAQIVSDLGTAPVADRASRQAERGRAFLAKVGK